MLRQLNPHLPTEALLLGGGMRPSTDAQNPTGCEYARVRAACLIRRTTLHRQDHAELPRGGQKRKAADLTIGVVAAAVTFQNGDGGTMVSSPDEGKLSNSTAHQSPSQHEEATLPQDSTVRQPSSTPTREESMECSPPPDPAVRTTSVRIPPIQRAPLRRQPPRVTLRGVLSQLAGCLGLEAQLTSSTAYESRGDEEMVSEPEDGELPSTPQASGPNQADLRLLMRRIRRLRCACFVLLRV